MYWFVRLLSHWIPNTIQAVSDLTSLEITSYIQPLINYYTIELEAVIFGFDIYVFNCTSRC